MGQQVLISCGSEAGSPFARESLFARATSGGQVTSGSFPPFRGTLFLSWGSTPVAQLEPGNHVPKSLPPNMVSWDKTSVGEFEGTQTLSS